MKNIKGLTKLLLIGAAVMLALNAVLMSVSARDKIIADKHYSWYSLPRKIYEQPDFDVNLEDLKNYDTYAVQTFNDNKTCTRCIVLNEIRKV